MPGASTLGQRGVPRRSTPSTVIVSTTNTPPVASAGPNQHVTQIGATIQLDGSQSYDLDEDPLTYQWSLVSIPTGSKAALSNPNIVNPTFIADPAPPPVLRGLGPGWGPWPRRSGAERLDTGQPRARVLPR